MQDKELQNYMFKNYHKKIYTYNPEQYQFVDMLKKIYNVQNLSMVANDKINNQVVDFYTDSQKTEIRQFYNSSLFQDFVDEYIRFLKNEIPNVFPNEKFIIYQSKPTYRIHETNNLSVGEWHRDSQDKYFHYLNTINFYLPFTKLNEFNTIWMCKNIFDNTNTNIEPILLKNNEFTSNYFASVLHGNKINTSEYTRISIDFRIIPGSLYDETKMINTSSSNKKLQIGDYYSIMHF